MSVQVTQKQYLFPFFSPSFGYVMTTDVNQCTTNQMSDQTKYFLTFRLFVRHEARGTNTQHHVVSKHYPLHSTYRQHCQHCPSVTNPEAACPILTDTGFDLNHKQEKIYKHNNFNGDI